MKLPEQSPLFPLPPDYHDLTEDGQRQARVNAASLWQYPTVDRRLQALVWASSLLYFDRYYLWPDPENEFNPQFYEDMPVESGDAHVLMYSTWARNPASMIIAPRGFTKSNQCRKTIVQHMVTRPGWRVMYTTNSGSNSKETGETVRTQLSQNPRIYDDFAPEFPGNRIVPKRNEASFANTAMTIRNGAKLRCTSVDSHQRGLRPHEYWLDDPENEQKQSTDMELVRWNMERLIFNVALPMVQQPGRFFRWIATFVSKKHFAWKAMQVVRGPDGVERAIDPRFAFWHRLFIDVEWQDTEGNRRGTWPQMWPSEWEKKRDPSLAKRVTLETIEKQVGPSVFRHEYRGRPSDSEANYFPSIGPESHGWSWEEVDEWSEHQPWRSKARIRWKRRDGNIVSIPMSIFLQSCHVGVTLDTAYTSKATSDWKVACVWACTPQNELFVLGMWAARKPEPELARNGFLLASQFHARSMHPEVVRESVSLYNTLQAIVATRSSEFADSEWFPLVVPLRPGSASKSSRIAALKFRFEQNLVYFPFFKVGEEWFANLMRQIEEFNPEVEDGGLEHDDHLDTVSMANMVMRRRMPDAPPSAIPDPWSDKLAMLKEGRSDHPSGMHAGVFIDWKSVPVQDVLEVFDAAVSPKLLPGAPATRA